MSRSASVAISILVWCLGLVPATLIALWMGLAEFTWAGALKAFGILAVLLGLFELLRSRIEAMLARRSRHNAQN